MSGLQAIPVPLGNAIIIKCNPVEKATASGIILTESVTAALMPDSGTVVGKGRGVYTTAGVLIASELEIGDKVLFSTNTRNRPALSIEGDENGIYFVMKDSDIMAREATREDD